MRTLKYIYYKLLLMHSRGEDSNTSAGLAVITISVIFFTNIFTIGAFLRKTDILPRFINNPRDGVLLMVAILIIDYFLFMYKRKYLSIKEMFVGESKRKKIIGGTLVVVYCFLSFILSLALAAYKPGKI